jgi:thiamine biosynthesis lipoprotein
MQRHSFETIGTTFTISIWDDIPAERFEEHVAVCMTTCDAFDREYSRFRPDSLVCRVRDARGAHTVPRDLVAMLRMYATLNRATNGVITPTVGVALEDIGYDQHYSLVEREEKQRVPSFDEALTILNDTEIEIHEPVLLDLGALGKGYLIDMLFDMLLERGIERFLVDGSGDVRYRGAGEPIVAGLEHPLDTTSAIGTFAMSEGALCASATNRRAWGNGRNHYVDPHTGASPQDVIATWVYAKTAAEADGLSSALFFVPPGVLAEFDFEYLVLRRDMSSVCSPRFAPGLFA